MAAACTAQSTRPARSQARPPAPPPDCLGILGVQSFVGRPSRQGLDWPTGVPHGESIARTEMDTPKHAMPTLPPRTLGPQ